MGRVGRIHFVCLAVALLDLFLYLRWKISFRGQGFDILVSVLPLITASNVMFNRFRKLPLAGKIYFVAMPVINLLLTPLYIFGTIAIPLSTLAETKNYEARVRPGVLSPPAANLIRKTFLFEQVVSRNIDYDIDNSTETRVFIVFKNDSVGVTVPMDERSDTTIFFKD